MKCDMDLIRGLLQEIEAMPADSLYETRTSSLPADRAQLAGHLQLLDQAGFVAGFGRELSGNAICSGLTWQGHQFLNAARSDRVWNEAKKALREKGVSVSVGVLTQLLSKIAGQMLGL